MASTYTQNLSLENPTPADPATNNTWGTTENTGRTLVDSAVSGILSLSVAGAVNVTLTSTQGAADQSRNAHFVYTGVLTGNVIVLYPAGKSRVFSVINSTTGAFSLSVGASNGAGGAAGTTTAIPQGGVLECVSDGTNVTPRVTALSSGIITIPPTGAVVDFAGSSAPSGWLFCDGSSQLRTDFAALFAVVGTTFGAADGTHFNLPDLRGRVSAGLDNMNGTTAQNRITNAISGIVGTTLGGSGGNQSLTSHTHAVIDPGHVHGLSDPTHSHTFVGGSAFFAGTSGVGGGSSQAVLDPGTSFVQGATTDPAPTGQAVSSAGSGTSNQATGAGASQNMPPVLMLNKIIKT